MFRVQISASPTLHRFREGFRHREPGLYLKHQEKHCGEPNSKMSRVALRQTVDLTRLHPAAVISDFLHAALPIGHGRKGRQAESN